MLELINNGKTVKITYDKAMHAYAIKNAKDIKVTPKEVFTIETELEAKLSHNLDELVILNENQDTPDLFVMTDNYSDQDTEEDSKINLVLFYNGDKNTTIKAGTTLAFAKCYHACDDTASPYYLSALEKNMPIMYVDETVRVQSVTGKQVPIELMTNADNTRYLKVSLPALETTETVESEEVDE